MIVTVIHNAFEKDPVTVAEVNSPALATVDEALEYAYRWTNNIMGSWSRTDVEDNNDQNPNVTVLAPLIESNGKTYGLRSTSMNDLMIANGRTYKVSVCGFSEVA
jgi:hypothetical protein|tara:strand:- start:107 stop:421 length:315 start_codon:yes stop_codon:yes gene_type:complete